MAITIEGRSPPDKIRGIKINITTKYASEAILPIYHKPRTSRIESSPPTIAYTNGRLYGYNTEIASAATWYTSPNISTNIAIISIPAFVEILYRTVRAKIFAINLKLSAM